MDKATAIIRNRTQRLLDGDAMVGAEGRLLVDAASTVRRRPGTLDEATRFER